ncbi:MAG: hypothetical protein WDA07_13730 [Leucobacter sp.]
MHLDYRALSDAAAALESAAALVLSEPHTPAELGSGSPGPELLYSELRAERSATLTAIGELLRAQGRSCAETVALFEALDAQIAAQLQ